MSLNGNFQILKCEVANDTDGKHQTESLPFAFEIAHCEQTLGVAVSMRQCEQSPSGSLGSLLSPGGTEIAQCKQTVRFCFRHRTVWTDPKRFTQCVPIPRQYRNL